MTATALAPTRVRSPRAAPRPAPRPTTRASSAPVERSRSASRSGGGRAALSIVTPAKRGFPTRAVTVVAVAIVFGSMLISAVFHSVLVSGQNNIDDLSHEIEIEQKRLELDRLQLATLSSPERIATAAEDLGLVFAERQTWISPGSSSGSVVTGEPEAPVETIETGPRASELAAGDLESDREAPQQ